MHNTIQMIPMADVRLIDANALLNSFDVAWMVEYDETGCGMRKKAIPTKTIEAAHIIDAVPVVRCRECEYRGDELKCPMCFDEWDEDEPGFLRIDKTVDDGFCHMGTKMDGGAEG